jgi:hypothetical protein
VPPCGRPLVAVLGVFLDVDHGCGFATNLSAAGCTAQLISSTVSREHSPVSMINAGERNTRRDGLRVCRCREARLSCRHLLSQFSCEASLWRILVHASIRSLQMYYCVIISDVKWISR